MVIGFIAIICKKKNILQINKWLFYLQQIFCLQCKHPSTLTPFKRRTNLNSTSSFETDMAYIYKTQLIKSKFVTSFRMNTDCTKNHDYVKLKFSYQKIRFLSFYVLDMKKSASAQSLQSFALRQIQYTGVFKTIFIKLWGDMQFFLWK